MDYTIERDDSPREPFGDYRYLIRRGGVLVAVFWHDYRGDDHGIEFPDGRRESCPIGGMAEFLGSGPLELPEPAVAWLRKKLE